MFDRWTTHKALPLTLPLLFVSVWGCSEGVLTGGRGSTSSADRSGANNGIDGDGSETPSNTPPDEKGIEGIGWSSRYPRLSHVQWENTVRDLLRLEEAPGIAETFSLDPDDSRFDTKGAHIVSANLWLDYQRGAETAATESTTSYEEVERFAPGATSKDAFLAAFLTRAFRRPVSDEETAAYGALFDAGATVGDAEDDFLSGARLVVSTALQSPHFLYRPETSTEADGDRIWLSPFEVANRLSFSLWNTMPSNELLAAAEAGELTTDDSVLAWATDMLADPRALPTLVSFHEQFFHTGDYGTIAKNETLFPSFTPDLAPTLREEARLFIEETAVHEDGGIARLLTSNVTFVNSRTAPFYDLEGEFPDELTRVELDATRRAGILTQIGFLSRFGSQTQSDPILRGVHISLDLLCSDLPAPPPNIPPLPEFEPGQTNRERVELSTKEAPCNGCHEPVINPLGFAFEHFDAIGAWRDLDNGKPVDAAAEYELDGEMVNYSGAVELIRLLSESSSLHRCYAEAWLEYLMGRPPATEEDVAVNDAAALSQSTSSASALLANLMALDTFRARPKETF